MVWCCVVFKDGDYIRVMWCNMVLRGVFVFDFPT